VVAYERERHEAALMRFTEKVLGPEICARRRRVIDTFHDAMPGRERLPLRHVIMDGDVVAGTLGYMPADFLVGGERVAARFTHDLLVDPEYRGGGLGKLIVQNAHDLGDFFPGGMWMTNPCYKIHLSCGFDDAPALTTYTSVLDPASFAARRGFSPVKKAAGLVGLGVTRAMAMKRARDIVARDGALLQAVDRFDPAMDGAWLDLAKGYSVTRVRDAAYLNWKYVDHPWLDYRAFVATEGGRARGYMLWRPAPAGATETRAVIPDFLVGKGDARTLRLLAARVILDAASAGIDSVAVLTTQGWAAEALRGLGFIAGQNRNVWVVAGWCNRMPEEWLRDLDRWHVVLGDSDGDMWTGSM
jgi:GNAT superfamily N-acetyltransferase